ncbi:MAG: tripartite tricarboxylate transporter substrate binding protein [Betaproteobacteria bacterium]|nr:tripartite tricarboxylate transporter substrate binding protein [Betaproteobacteria bacterium]
MIDILKLAVLAAAVTAPPAYPQSPWPQKPVRVIVPANPGGAADVLARRVARQLEEDIKQSFVVENRPGAGALIGSQAVVRAAPDGYMLLVHGVGGHVVPSKDNPNALDPARDFTHIAYFGGVPVIFAVNPSVAANDVPSLIAFANSLPNGMSWGSPGLGTRSHIVGELLREATGAKMVHIPYKGATQALTDLMSNQISAVGMTLSSIRPVMGTNKFKPIAVSSIQRISGLPNVPTFAEAGHPKLTGSSWFGMSGPPGMDAALTARINADVNRALGAPEVKKAFLEGSFEMVAMSAAEFTKFFLAEIAVLAPYLASN